LSGTSKTKAVTRKKTYTKRQFFAAAVATYCEGLRLFGWDC